MQSAVLNILYSLPKLIYVRVGFKHTSPTWEHNLGTEISFQREEVFSVWWTRALDGQVARRLGVWQLTRSFYVQSHLSLGKWLASVPPAIQVLYYCYWPLSCSTPPSYRESSIPVDVARQRELKWLEMFSNWDKWLSRRFQKVWKGWVVGRAEHGGGVGPCALGKPKSMVVSGLHWGQVVLEGRGSFKSRRLGQVSGVKSMGSKKGVPRSLRTVGSAPESGFLPATLP